MVTGIYPSGMQKNSKSSAFDCVTTVCFMGLEFTFTFGSGFFSILKFLTLFDFLNLNQLLITRDLPKLQFRDFSKQQ